MGIILMSFGHLYNSAGESVWLPALDPLLAAIYLFHMPLFFILAGCTFSARRSFTSFIKRKTQTLLVPYVVFSPYYLVRPLAASIWPSLAQTFGNRAGNTLAEQLFSVFVMGNGLWFLLALFFGELLVWGLHRLVGERPLIWMLVGLGLCAWYYGARSLCPGFFELPFQLPRALEAAGFMCWGIALKQRFLSLGRASGGVLGLLCLIGFVLLACPMVLKETEGTLADSWMALTAVALVGSLSCIGFSIAMARARLLEWIGRESIMYYTVQALCINVAKIMLFDGLGLHLTEASFAIQFFGGLVCTALAMLMMAACDVAVRRWFPWAIGAPHQKGSLDKA